MDRTLILLLVALALVYMAWRAARAQTQRAVAARAAEQERNTFTLEPYETATARGFIVVAADGERMTPTALSWSEHGLEAVTVAELRAGSDGAGDAAFTPGSAVELIPTDDNAPQDSAAGTGARQLEVWNSSMTTRAGALSAGDSQRIFSREDDDAAGECLVLQERLDGGRRTGLLLLLVRQDIALDG